MFIFFLLVNGTFTINPIISNIKIIDKLIEMYLYLLTFIKLTTNIFKFSELKVLKMAKKILTFGDSNTFGTPPMLLREGNTVRYGENIRWPMIMQNHLSPDWKVIEEGLPGRTTSLPDPEMGDHMNGQLGLKIALDSHGPIDLLIIMLGTNDSKIQFGLEATQIASGLASLLNIANTPDMQRKHNNFQILIITPPQVKEQNALEKIFFQCKRKNSRIRSFL